MFKIKSFWMAFHKKSIAAISIQSRHFFALALSLTAHLSLVLLLGVQGRPIHGLEPDADQLVNTVNISLIKQDVAANTLGSKLVDKGKEKALPQVLPVIRPSVVEEVPIGHPSIITIATPPEPYYFQAKELTEKPSVVLDISPGLAFFLPSGLPQLAVLRLLINEHGEIDQVVMENSSLPAQAQQLVIDAFSKIKFQPGKIDGIPVKSQLRIEVTSQDAAPL